MPKHGADSFCEVGLDEIVSQQDVIHPCLDWVKGQLIVGVDLKDSKRAVLSSTRGLVRPQGLGAICKQGEKFRGAVSDTVAEKFVRHLKGLQDGREPQNDHKLAGDIANYLRRFVVFPQMWLPDTLAPWILGSFLFPIFQTYPYLRLTSLAPGCGKSLLGELIARLSFNGEFMVAPTEAQLFHLPEISRGVQVWDEVECSDDGDKKRFNAILPILLSGYRNGGAVPRQVGKNFEKSTRYHVFCPRVFIGLSKLPEPAQQRTIQVQLVKRTEHQKVEHYVGWRHIDEEHGLKERCLLWALKNAESVNRFYQDDGLRRELEQLLGAGRISDDIWLPLFAVASAAGQDSPMLKKAAKQLAEVKTNSFQKPSSPFPSPAPAKVEAVNESKPLVEVAQSVLKFSNGLTPEELAQKVSIVYGRNVTAQKVSKALSKIGVRATKQNGRRIFLGEMKRSSPTIGQQGQEDRRKGELEASL